MIFCPFRSIEFFKLFTLLVVRPPYDKFLLCSTFLYLLLIDTRKWGPGKPMRPRGTQGFPFALTDSLKQKSG